MQKTVELFVLELKVLMDRLHPLVEDHQQLKNRISDLRLLAEMLAGSHTVHHHQADLENILMVMEVLHREDRKIGVMVCQDHHIQARNEVTGKVLCLMGTLVLRICHMVIQLGVLHLTSLMVILNTQAIIHLLTDGRRMIQDTLEMLRKNDEIVQEATRLLLRIVHVTTRWLDSSILHLTMWMKQVLLEPLLLRSDRDNITFSTRLEELHLRVATTRVIRRFDLHLQVVRILS